MKLIKAFALAAMLSLGVLAPAMAADTVITGPGRDYPVNLFLVQARAADLGTAYTNATTTATLIASASGTTAVSIPATKADYTHQYIKVCYSVDGTKSTGTTGSVSVYLNAAVVAASTRYISSAAVRSSVGGCFMAARSSAAAQTVGLYGVSADTSTFTVNAAYIEVWNVTFG